MIPPVRNPIQSLVNELQLKSTGSMGTCSGNQSSPGEARIRSPSRWYCERVSQSTEIITRVWRYAYLVRSIVFAHGSDVFVKRIFVYRSLSHIDHPKWRSMLFTVTEGKGRGEGVSTHSIQQLDRREAA